MKFFIAALLLTLLAISGLAQHDLPVDTASIQLWFSADSNMISTGDKIDTLYDLSGSNNHAIQANSANQPLIVTNNDLLNNHSTISFNGSTSFFDLMSGYNFDSATVFCVFKKAAAA